MSRPVGAPPGRAVAHALLIALLAAVVLVIGGGPAAAVPGIPDCKEAPTPEVPGRGVVGFFDTAPEQLPPEQSPWVDGSTTSIYDQYGYAGLRWNTYDLGCGPDAVRSPDATVGSAVSNWIFTVPKAAVAATGALLSAAYQPTFLDAFDPLVEGVVDVLQTAVFEQWAGLAVAALGFLLIWRARKASLASTASAIGWAFVVMMLATVVFRWPLAAGDAADEAVTASLGSVSDALGDSPSEEPGGPPEQAPADPGRSATGNMQEALLYQAWLGGTFGDADSAVARTYGPVIFDSQALTWRQAAVLADNPDQGRQIIEAKQDAFAEAAEQVREADPDAYEYLTGNRSDSRVGYALLSVLAAACAVPFLVLSALLILGALLIVRFGVMLFPAFATLGLFPPMRGLVVGIGNTMAAALINAVVFGVGTAVMVRAFALVMSPGTGLAPWLVVVMLLLMTIVMWAALSPFRRLTQMVGLSRNHFGEAVGGGSALGRRLTRGGGKIASIAVGGAGGVVLASQLDDEEQAPGRPRRRAEGDRLVMVAADPAADPAPGTAAGGAAVDPTPTAPPIDLAPTDAAATGPSPTTAGQDTGHLAAAASIAPISNTSAAGHPASGSPDAGAAADTGWRPLPQASDAAPPPIEPEDAEDDVPVEVFRPSDRGRDEQAEMTPGER